MRNGMVEGMLGLIWFLFNYFNDVASTCWTGIKGVYCHYNTRSVFWRSGSLSLRVQLIENFLV